MGGHEREILCLLNHSLPFMPMECKDCASIQSGGPLKKAYSRVFKDAEHIKQPFSPILLYSSCGNAVVFAGNWYSSSSNNRGTNGNYWSSTVNDSNNSYNLNFNSTNVNPANNNNKNNGFSVRCVAGS